MIERRALSRSEELLGRFPAVVLIGPRQVGKTTLALACSEDIDGLYLDLESRRDLSKLADLENYLVQNGLSPELSSGFYSAIEDVKPDKTFVIYGGDDRFRLKPGIEAISLPRLQQELLSSTYDN